MSPHSLHPLDPDALFGLASDFDALYPLVAKQLQDLAHAWSLERSDASRYRFAYRLALELLQRAMLGVIGVKLEIEEFLKEKRV